MLDDMNEDGGNGKANLRENELELLNSAEAKSSLRKVKEDVYQTDQHTIIISDFDKKTPFLHSPAVTSSSAESKKESSAETPVSKNKLDKEFNELTSKIAKLEKKKFMLKSNAPVATSGKKQQKDKKLKKKMRKSLSKNSRPAGKPKRMKNNKIRK